MKYDIEAYFPASEMYGEISSTSLCTDYQSRRLNIKCRVLYNNMQNENNSVEYTHTINGTGIAIPRMLITLIETNQTDKGTIKIPKVLQPFMYGKDEIKK